ncbi:MAG TPA: hypothetical protein VJ727_05845 [Rhodanobacteraceae bacterium]|nr:hypothetical protein [Rhodanobacteraceae bacterium]
MESIALSRIDVLRALSVTPLRLRARSAIAETASMSQTVPVAFDKRVALLRSQEEIEQPVLAMLYTKITEAISTLGLQCVRMTDAENDPRVRVLVFGEVPLPPAIGAERAARVDALAVLHADRARKRALWDALQRLAQEQR